MIELTRAPASTIFVFVQNSLILVLGRRAGR
jgi:hypothetical protein